MIKKQSELQAKLIKVIEDDKFITNISELILACGIKRSTFYKKFQTDSDDYKELLQYLEFNKTDLKKELKIKMFNSKNPSSHLQLFRILADNEEINQLEGKGELSGDITIKFVSDSVETHEEINEITNAIQYNPDAETETA